MNITDVHCPQKHVATVSIFTRQPNNANQLLIADYIASSKYNIKIQQVINFMPCLSHYMYMLRRDGTQSK